MLRGRRIIAILHQVQTCFVYGLVLSELDSWQLRILHKAAMFVRAGTVCIRALQLRSCICKCTSKMRSHGPQIVEPVGLLCKPDGRYQILPGQGAKRIMALRLAGYKAAVADISVPKKEGVEVRAENIDERPSQERNDAPKEPEEPVQTENPSPTKEEAQTANPTMARTSRDPASGQDFGKSSTKGERQILLVDQDKKPSVRKKLEECKKIADERQPAKDLAKAMQKIVPNKTPDQR